jgi:uncharacterized membrane protein
MMGLEESMTVDVAPTLSHRLTDREVGALYQLIRELREALAQMTAENDRLRAALKTASKPNRY